MQFVLNNCRVKKYALQKPKCFSKKIWRMTRWTAILFFMGCLHVSANTYSQKVTLHARNEPLSLVLKSIQQQTGCNIVVRTEMLAGTRPITVSIKDLPVDKALDVCLQGQPITYDIIGNTILLKFKKRKPDVTQTFVTTILPQLPDITGKVTDTAGNPMANVSVFVKGTGHGTVTDTDGYFLLKNVDPNTATIVFDYVGYKEQQFKLNGRQALRVMMQPSHSELDAMQVIAYGTTTKRFSTGAVSTVTAEEITKQPVSNPLAALEGRVPGLYISQSTGNADGAFKITLRGQNSIAGGNNPLYIIDGVPYTSTSIGSTIINTNITAGGNPLSNINPSDIESITVLKDADATAIYGSRGANGVILITTKKGQPGKTKVELNFYTGIEQVGHRMDLLNTQQYLEMRHEAFANDNATPQYYDEDINGTWDTTRYTDWQKKLIGNTGNITNVQASISGGNENSQFLISSTYRKETSVFPGSFADENAGVHINLSNKSKNGKFKSLLSASYNSDIDHSINSDLTYQSISLIPDAPEIYDSLGNYNWDILFENPYAYLLKKYNSNAKNLIGNINLDYQLTKHLHLILNGGYTNLQLNENSQTPQASINPLSTGVQSSAIFGNNNFSSWIIEPQAQWESLLGKGKLNILIGSTFQENDQTGQTLDATGYTSDALLGSISGASTITKDPSAPPIDIKYRYQAVFGRINYNLDNKYIFNLTGRRDGSSRFGNDRQFANFGALGAGWIFSEENFIKHHLPFLSYGKLRASYGITGNDQIPDYGYLSTYSATTYSYQGSAGLIPTRLANADYGWETNKKLEAALDLGFLKDRILFSIDYFRNRSSNQLVGYPLPTLTGFSNIQYNLPALVQNTGIEIVLNTENIKSKDVDWSTVFNITVPRNELLSYPNLAGSSYKNKYVVGKSLQIYKSFHYEGVDPQNGVYVFEDVVNGGTTANPVSPDDLLAIKERGQKFYGGFQNDIRYKNFGLSVFLQFVKQTGISYMASGFPAPGMLVSNQPVQVLERWQQPGDKTNVEKFTQTVGDAYSAWNNSVYYGDNGITDASFIRLKNISISYSLPDQLLKKTGIQNCRIYIQGQNLFTITKYIGFDPESQDNSHLPPLRVITAGFQLTL